MTKNKTIYYWASTEKNSNGEGILATNFLKLIKKNHKDYKLIPLNKYKSVNQNTITHDYILPLWASIILWKYYLLGKRISYINFLPAWNFILILMLPPKTIIGPVTGSYNRIKYNLIIKFFTFIGIKILKIRHKKILFSHGFFSKHLKNSKNYFFNFLLYNFKVDESLTPKKYDFIFYIKKHENKMNNFLLKLINKLSYKYKICVIGEKIDSNKNIFNKGFVSRKKAINLIQSSRAAVSSPENLFSFFLLDCISKKLIVFYNKNYNPKKYLKTNLLVPISFNNYKKSLKIILKKNFNSSDKKIVLKKVAFDHYLNDFK